MRPTTPLLLAAISLCASACVTPRPTAIVEPDSALAAALSQGSDGEFVRPNMVREVRSLALSHPNHVPTLLADAALAHDAGATERARASLERALSVDPGHVDSLLLYTRISSETGNLSVAEKRLREAIQVRPDDSRLREALAGVLYLQSDFDDALAELETADALAGEDAPRWRTNYHRGLVAEARKNMVLAHEMYQLSWLENPDFEPALRRLRWLNVGGDATPVTVPTDDE
ncbi:MAG: tetratricopeptide repeat protein [Planctomycetota bacterium]